MSVLSVEELTIHYYTLSGIVKAVRDVSFTVGEKESVCLVGESGSGKSTIGLAVAGALPDNARIVKGRIMYKNEVNLLTLQAEEAREYFGKKITMIFQDPAATLNPLFTIGEQLGDVIKQHMNIREREEVEKLSQDMLRKVGLPDPPRVLRSYPHELSGGMLQRASIAIALSPNPELLIADEPTTMLDVTLQAQILDLLKKLKEEMGLSILFITHNLGVAAEICDRTIVIYAGTVFEEGSTEEVLLSPLHPYTVKLLMSVPRAQARVEKLRYIPGTLPDLRNPPPGCPFAPRCEEAMEECKRRFPPMTEVTRGHRVACYKYLKR